MHGSWLQRPLVVALFGVSVLVSALSPGEHQLCLVMAAHGQATPLDDGGRPVFLVDPAVHERLLEALARPSLALRAAKPVGEAPPLS